MRIRVRPELELRSVTPADARALDALVSADRERLARFMPWAAGQTIPSTREFIAAALEQERRDDGFQAALVVDASDRRDRRLSPHRPRQPTTSIGYWLAAPYEGRGLMTAAVGALVEHAFEVWRLHRIELRIAPANERSRALAARLGFTEEGVLREAERFGDEHRDLIMHSLLAREWRARRAPRTEDGAGRDQAGSKGAWSFLAR